MATTVLREVVKSDGRVRELWLARPPVNVLDLGLLAELDRALQAAEEPVLVIRGEGKLFSAGVDVADHVPDKVEAMIQGFHAVLERLATHPAVSVAAVHGAALGGGLELALACDFRLAADTAVMGLSEVRLGIMPGAGGTQRLARLLGVARAKELVMTGRRIDARRALELGVVSRVVPGAELAAAGDELLAELAACAPLSLAMAKRAIDEGVSLPLADALALERRCYDVTLMSDDRNEGLRAFAEKRPPRFTGR